MHRSTRAFAALAALCVAACQPPHPDDSTDASVEEHPDASVDETPDAGVQALRVLFIGNSYTYVNDLPGMLSRIAATAGEPPSISTEEDVAGGYTLYDHLAYSDARARIAEGGWTHVVLQGQSLEAHQNPQLFLSAAYELGDLAVDAGARPTFFATWARAPTDPSYAIWRDVTPTSLQDAITHRYATAAARWPQSVLVCVGEAFRRTLAQHPEIELHQVDFSHPTVAGTYLAASTFYVALTGRPVPAQSEVPAGLSPQVAEVLREVALVGTQCADVRYLGVISLLDERLTRDEPDGGPAFEFGAAGSPVSATFLLRNEGEANTGLAPRPLAPPFVWAADGGFPGGSGSATVGGVSYPFCGSELPAQSSCALAVRFSGEVSASGAVTVDLTDAYATSVSRGVHGTTTSRALLAVNEGTSPSGCGDPTCFLPACTGPTCPVPIDVEARVGETKTFGLVVANRGAAATTAISEGTPLVPPFYWGSSADGGTFPGGSGTGTVDGVSYDYCSQVVAPGEQCMVTVTFAPTFETLVRGIVDLAYSDTSGALSPNAKRVLSGQGLPPADGGL